MLIKNKFLDKYKNLLILSFLLVVFSLLCLINIFNSPSLISDEVYTLEVAKLSWQEMPGILIHETNPPLFYFMAKIWVLIFGSDNDIIFRLMPVLLGLINIVLIYFLGKKYFNRQVGLIASLIMVLSPLNIIHSTEARMYPLVITLSLLLLLIFHNLFFLKKDSLLNWLSFFTVTLLLAYTHLFSAILIALLFFMLLLFRQELKINWQQIIKVVIVYLLVLLIFSFWFLPSMPYKFNSGTSSAWYFNLPPISSLAYNVFTDYFFRINGGTLASFSFAYLFFDLCIIFFMASNFVKIKLLSAPRHLLLEPKFDLKKIFLLYIYLGTALVIIFSNIWTIKFYLFVLPVFYLLLAAGISDVLREHKKLGRGLFCLFIFLLFIFSISIKFDRGRYFPDLANILQQENIDNSSLVLLDINIDTLALSRYYKNDSVIKSINFENDPKSIISMTENNWRETFNEENIDKLSDVVGDKRRVFYRFVNNRKSYLVMDWFFRNGWRMSKSEVDINSGIIVYLFEKDQ
ncbi:MAG: glycosyltransferase family 39 protein [Candidatus Buchananbacteria bacterium]|nr:glycosyltransferase family 39 protein [Candidatus Buchananbacteria bacterium]